MADNVLVTVPTAGVSIAAEDVGGEFFQQVKLVGGAALDTTGIGANGTIGVSGSVTVAGSVSVSGAAQVSGTVTVGGTVTITPTTLTVNTAPTVAGASITIQQGASVSAQVSGTVTVANGPSVTIQQGASVSAVVSGTVTALLPGSTTGASGVSGAIVWLGASQTVLVSTQVSGTVTVNGSVSVSGTGLVSIVAGASISVLGVANTVSTIVTILGTQVVTVVPGLSVSAVVSGTVSVSNILNTVVATTTQASGVTGMVVYLAASQTMNLTVTNTVTITGTDIARTQIMIVISSTVMLGGTTALLTVYQGAAQTVAGAGVWVVPAGKTFRLLSIAGVVRNSITTTPAIGIITLFVSAATPTHTSAGPRIAQIFIGAPNASVIADNQIQGLSQDVAAGVTVGVGVKGTTASATMVEAIVQGYLYP